MISLREITLKNRRELFSLSVKDTQKKYIASNLSSIASSYVLSVNGSKPFPLIIYKNDLMIGFVLIVYGDTGYEQPGYAKDSYCILRFMIDEKYQNKGYGREAFKSIVDFIKTFPAKEATLAWISYKAENKVAKDLYESFDFKETKETYNNESIAILKL